METALAAIASVKQLGVQTHSDELPDGRIRLAVDQQQVQSPMALPMISLVDSQSMVAILLRQRFVFCQERDDIGNESVEIRTMTAPLLALEVPAKRGRSLNPPDSDRPGVPTHSRTRPVSPYALRAWRLRLRR